MHGIYNKLKHSFNFKLTFQQNSQSINVTLPLLKIFLFLNETKINVMFFDQLNNIDMFAALPLLSHTPVITNTMY